MTHRESSLQRTARCERSEDRSRLRALVGRLTDRLEAARARPWRVNDPPADFVDNLLGAIVGLEIPLTRLVGKWKMSQNRPAAGKGKKPPRVMKQT